MHCRAIDHVSIFQGKPRVVVGTHNAVIHQMALREWSAEVRAGLRHGEDSLSATNQQNGCPLVIDAGWLVIGQLSFRQDGCKLFRKYLTAGLINPNSML